MESDSLVLFNCPMMRLISRILFRAGLLLCLVLSFTQTSLSYSVLTHEEIVDLLWADHIKKLLLKRFPDATEDQLKEAHASAYSGFSIPSLCDFPFSTQQISHP